MGNIVKALRTSPAQTFTNVTFPEGYAVARMGERLEPCPGCRRPSSWPRPPWADPQRARPEVTNLEGLLFPDTYQVGGGETEDQIVARMAKQMTGWATASASRRRR